MPLCFLLILSVLLLSLGFVAFLLNQHGKFVRLIANGLITVVDVITLPVYFLLDKPWKVKRLSQTQWADRHYEPNGNYTYWECKNRQTNTAGSKYSQLLVELQNFGHLSELLPIVEKLYKNLNCIGRRTVLGRCIENGTTKFELGDFEWLTYEEAVQRIRSLAKALAYKFQLKRGDRVAIMADTG